MPSFDITATCVSDTTLSSGIYTSFQGTAIYNEFPVGFGREGSVVQQDHALLSFRIPTKPLGAESIAKVSLVVTFATLGGSVPGTREILARRLDQGSLNWSEASASYKYKSGTANPWTRTGGDRSWGTAIGHNTISLSGITRQSTFSFDITAGSYDWGQNDSVLLEHATRASGLGAGAKFMSLNSATATTALKPHIVITFPDNPPNAITDLILSPDISLSEASYTYRQRATLKWTASDASDFGRYRIRKGVNRSLAADHTHLTFVSSRGTTSYLDTTLYTDSSTVYYSLYVEDQRNRSASTNANVSNIVSWTKPNAVIGSASIGSSASTLQEVEVRVRTTTMTNAKKSKIIWADGGYSFTQNLTSAGGYLFGRHRYTKATAGYTIRAQIEDIYGFRSAPDSYATSVTISNLGPVAKIVASPSRQRTAGTYSFGTGPGSGTAGPVGFVVINRASTSPIDGIITRFRTRASTITTGIVYGQIWRDIGSRLQCVYSDSFTLATTGVNLGRDVNWHVLKGDYVGIQTIGTAPADGLSGTPGRWYVATSSAIYPGTTIDKYRFFGDAGNISAKASSGFTNPVHFSAKDSFARGSNRSINRFRWDTDYNGTFGSNFETGATTSFYYAWTTATTQFVAVRAVDDTHASSIDIAGVVIETESTFRIPDDLRDVVTHRSSPRSRAFTQSPVLSRDYGIFDFGAIEHRTIAVRGHATTQSSTVTGEYIDIARVSAAFQQRKRIYVVPGESTSTAVQGYIVESPIVEDSEDPVAKDWSITLAIAT